MGFKHIEGITKRALDYLEDHDLIPDTVINQYREIIEKAAVAEDNGFSRFFFHFDPMLNRPGAKAYATSYQWAFMPGEYQLRKYKWS